jgi:hypothetical protein
MRLLHAFTAAAIVIAASGGVALAGSPKGEAQLAQEIEGRVAGEPVNCIPLHRIRSTRIIDRTAIVYDAGATIYVNRPANVETLDRFDTLVVKPFASQLCRIDSVQLIDSSLRATTGFLALGKFVPYTRAKD